MFGQTIRIFVSSTFKDMRAERDALHAGAFRDLKEYCRTQGFQFQAIDLRWGVPEGAAWGHRTRTLCLEEIRRCRTVSPRPSFVALIGQRYGWRPLPAVLTIEDRERLAASAADDRGLLDEWYLPDENNFPPVWRLRERSTAKERDPLHWRDQVESPLRNLILAGVKTFGAELSEPVRQADLSLTELEIRLGAEHAESADWQSFAYFREFSTPRDALAEPYVDLDESGAPADPRAAEKLADLKRRLVDNPVVRTQTLATTLEDGVVPPGDLERLNEVVLQDLRAAADLQIAAYRSRDALTEEVDAHKSFAQVRRRHYVGRQEDDRLLDYVSGHSNVPLVLAGPSGAGKTALVANLEAATRDARPNAVCVARYVGATGSSSALRSLIWSVHREVALHAGSEELDPENQSDPQSLLLSTAAMATGDRPVVILLDALDQLAPDDQALSCSWVPRELPPHCKLLVSCMIPGEEELEGGSECFPLLAGRLGPDKICSITPLGGDQLDSMFQGWLESMGRRVTPAQFSAVRERMAECPRPLFLRVLVELARTWTADTPVDALPRSIPTVIESLLASMEQDDSHGLAMVSTTLGLLAVSRSGLPESELVELLNQDRRVWEEFEQRSRYGVEVLDALPPILWSQLLHDLEFFLGETVVVRQSLLTFYHRQLARAARERYVTESSERRLRMAIVSRLAAEPALYPRGTPNVRRAYELGHQLHTLGGSDALDGLRRLLLDPDHVAAAQDCDLERDLLSTYARTEEVDKDLMKEAAAFAAAEFVKEGAPFAALPPSVLHSYLAYDSRKGFYSQFLELLARPASGHAASGHEKRVRARARVDLGGIVRRKGDLELARQHLRVVEEEEAVLAPADLSTGWYEIGYIHYLEDEYEAAARAMARSAEIGEDAGDPVGAAISRSVGNRANYYTAPSNAALDKYIHEELELLELFSGAQQRQPRAVRWVMNARAHLAEAYYLRGSVADMDEQVRELRANPWLKEFQHPQTLIRHEARLALLRGDPARAIRLWERCLSADNLPPEGASSPLLDYGLSLLEAGRTLHAALALSAAITRPRHKGNGFWQGRAREAAARLPKWARAIALSGAPRQ